MGYADFLRKVPLFAELPDADLQRLCSMIKEVLLAPGEVLFAEGDPGEEAYVIAEGEIEIIKASSGREVLLAVRASGDVIGEGALLEMAPRNATARARGACKLLAIHKTLLDELVQGSASAARVMFFTVLARWRATGAMLRQSEKMAQLGTLTAGVAHELNNPAAAVQRGAAQLGDALDELLAAERAYAALSMTEASIIALELQRRQIRASAARPIELDALTRGDREEEVEAWLEARQVPDAGALAPTLVTLGYETAGLDELAVKAGDGLPVVVRWLAANHLVWNRLAEISHGAGRISEIVKALKGYSYLDQAPVQDVDVHEGIDSTLVILRHKLKAGIKVTRDYAPDLPRISAWGSELNQVWTNILDNAADALADRIKDGSAEITIRTRREGDFVVVEIGDNGPGIPAEIQERIFEAFFTTKPPGKGTGLGLDISYRIVVHRHRGDIRVTSRPGQTTFVVKLPINNAADGKAGKGPTLNAVPPPTDAELRKILTGVHTIAVVGLSGKPDRPAYQVPAYLKDHGYRIIPVNPTLTEALGEKAYAELGAVPDPVDAVLLFVRSEAVPPVVEQAIEIGARTIWMQEGIVNLEAAERARAAGLNVVMDRCMRATWQRLMAAG
jgi:signal transduction histidine kinase/predicted CoA-binding protein